MKIGRVGALAAAACSSVLLLGSCEGRDEVSTSVYPTPGDFSVGTALFVVGEADREPGHDLHRVTAALWLPSNRLLVANAGTSELRLFDASARLERSWGRVGSGPGEFRSLNAAWQHGADSIVAYDFGLGKLYLTSIDGDGGREIPLSMEAAEIWGHLGGLTFLEARAAPLDGVARREGVLSVDTVVLTAVNIETRDAHPVGRVAWRTRYWATIPSGRLIQTTLPLHGGTVFAAGQGHVYVINTVAGSVDVVDETGASTMSFSVAWEARPITRARHAGWVDDLLLTFPRDQQSVGRRYLEGLPVAEFLPRADQAIVDDQGSLWVRQFPEPGASDAEWAVYTREGRRRGIGTLPASWTLMHVGSDFMVVSSPGGADQEVLTVHEIVWST